MTVNLSVPCSCLPGRVSCVVHHVCVVVLENHLYKTKHPFQRGTAGKKQTVYIRIILCTIVVKMEYAADLSHTELIPLYCVSVLSTQI